jgi:RimJ/RimL family protein N-acetyltransferase
MPNLDPEVARSLGESLPDHPFTFGARSLLLRGLANAWVRGPPDRYTALIVQSPWLPNEPMAFGAEPQEIWRLLRDVPGWDCVNLAADLAPGLRAVVEREVGTACAVKGDVYFILDQEPSVFRHPSVRPLRQDDADLFEEAPESLRPVGFASTVAALAGGVAAGGVVDGRLVSIISMSLSTEEFAEIGGHTLEPWRNQGFASAAGYLVAREVQARGMRPVWSTGDDNLRSQRVAQKLGFHEFGRRAYVIVPSLRGSGFRPPTAPVA